MSSEDGSTKEGSMHYKSTGGGDIPQDVSNDKSLIRWIRLS
jgi:hypothetical protein